MTATQRPTPLGLMDRYHAARRHRECPACRGSGKTFDYSAVTLHDCGLCAGDGWVRYKRRVAFMVALRGRIDHESGQ